MLSALVVLAAAVPQAPTPAVRVSNPATVERAEAVRFSMPWPRGRLRTGDQLQVAGRAAPWVPLVRWADGSVAVAQVHGFVRLDARAEAVLPLELVPPDPDAVAPAPAGDFAFPDRLPLEVVLADPWGREFVTRFQPDPAGAVDAAHSSELLRVRRFRGLLARRAEDGAIETWFAVQAWLVEPRGAGRAELTLALDNEPRPGEPVLGPARFASVELRVLDPAVLVHVLHRGALAIPAPVREPDGTTRVTLLRSSAAAYLGDRTSKAFRIDLLRPSGDPAAVRLAVEQPIVALPALDWVRATGAFGVHGGPAPTGAERLAELHAAVRPWWVSRDAGPFGSFGLPRDLQRSGVEGLPPSALHDVVRSAGRGSRLGIARLAVLQQGLRPTAGTTARTPEATAGLRRGLSSELVARPHGYTPLDYEHFMVDLPFDVWWLTGEPFALHELERAGRTLLPVLRTPAFRTSRGEGACLRAGVAIARATGRRELVTALLEHVHEVVLPLLGDDEVATRAHAIAQPPHPAALGPLHPFDVPWQMSLLVHGLHALWSETQDAEVRDAAVLVARRMAGACWIEGSGLAGFVSATDATVRSLPLGDGSGAVGVAIGAFVLAAEMAASPADRERFAARADEMVRGATAGAVPDRWLQLLEDRTARRR